MLKNISRANSAAEIADFLQKHIGEGTNQSHCKDACEATQRIKNGEIKRTIRAIIAVNNNCNDDCWCLTAQAIIALLRNSVEDLKANPF